MAKYLIVLVGIILSLSVIAAQKNYDTGNPFCDNLVKNVNKECLGKPSGAMTCQGLDQMTYQACDHSHSIGMRSHRCQKINIFMMNHCRDYGIGHGECISIANRVLAECQRIS